MDKKFTLELDSNDVNVIFNALVERPYKEVAHILATIQQQVQAQNASQNAPEEAEAKADGK